MRKTLTTLMLAAVAMLVVPSAARAEIPNEAIYVGLHGGANLATTDWDLCGGAECTAITPKTFAPIFGLRIGFQGTANLAFELGAAMLPISSEGTGGGGSSTVLKYDVAVLWHLFAKNMTPFIALGGGGYQKTSSGDLGDGGDFDPLIFAGVGFRGMITPWLAFRVDVRDVMTDGIGDNAIGNNIEITVGLDLFAWTKSKAPKAPLDTDKDGIADKEDKCPNEAGPASAGGCPDQDGDGLADAEDKCPAEAGPLGTKGCPDKDSDGIADADDKCPDAAGKAELGGCPDQDNDGIADGEDKCPSQAGPTATAGCPDQDGDNIVDTDDACPTEPGPAPTKGCPDKDGDGIADKDDKCPDVAGPPSAKGCPDKDGDTVADMDDKCPDVPGLVEQQGCMPAAVKKFTGAIQGIVFDTGSATIKKQSFKVLDGAVKVMLAWPSLRLRIEGHTDNVGKPEDNQKLSEDRAKSVRDYLVSKGVDAGRLEAVGYGDTKPKADNKKAAGRALNRRIEFTPIY
jgi:outer membrane protein OmpA-like peptidoglycan-associated protein